MAVSVMSNLKYAGYCKAEVCSPSPESDSYMEMEFNLWSLASCTVGASRGFHDTALMTCD